MKTNNNLDALISERYSKPMSLPFELNETLETIFNHRSCRHYSQEAVPEQTIELMVAAGQSASNSSNLQSWSVIAIEDPARRDRLATLSSNQEHIRACPLFLVWLADLSRLETLGKRRELPHDGLHYSELLTVGVVDAALAAQNAAVAAESIGLSITYIGGIRNNPIEVAKELGLPPRIFAVFGMCIGYRHPEKPAAIKPRLPQKAVLHREQYDALAVQNAADEYCENMNHFYENQKMKTRGDWAQHSLYRIRGAESLNGRDHMLQALKVLGFQLR